MDKILFDKKFYFFVYFFFGILVLMFLVLEVDLIVIGVNYVYKSEIFI